MPIPRGKMDATVGGLLADLYCKVESFEGWGICK